MKRGVLCILMLSCVLLLSACKVSQTGGLPKEVNAQSGNNVERPPSATNSDILELEHMINEQKAMEQLNRLCENFAVEMGREAKGRVYTNYCGGVYLNEDGNLVVCVTKDYDLNSGRIEQYTENPDIILQVVDYPYYVLEEESAYIREQYERLREAYEKGIDVNGNMGIAHIKDLLDCTNGWGIYEDVNRVIVAIRDLDDEKIETFRNLISDNEMIDFEVGGYFSY